MLQRHDTEKSDLPNKLAKPAKRALEGAGYTRIEQFAKLSEDEVMQLHGMGPKEMAVTMLIH